MLQRTLLYTAMSRAKELLVLVSTPGSIHDCVKKEDTMGRRTNLKSRIEHFMKDSLSSSPSKVKANSEKMGKQSIPKKQRSNITTKSFDDLPF
jgi:hypothetical protein